MTFTLDTNIIIHIIRDAHVWEHIKKNYFPKGMKGKIFISAVTIGEVRAFAARNRWGKIRTRKLLYLINAIEIVKVVEPSVQSAYVDIDIYSQNKHKSLTLPKRFSPRNMGKNDIWIAATSSALNTPLLTTDRDFEHLDGVFLEVVYIDVEEIKNQN